MAKDVIPAEQRPAAGPADGAAGPGRTALREGLRLQTWLLGVIALAVVIVMLAQARLILISLVVAIILFSLTADAINAIARLKLGRVGVPKWLASLAAVALITAGLLALSALLVSEVNTIVTAGLAYAAQAEAGLAELFGWLGADVQQAVVASIRSVEIGGYLRAIAGQTGTLVSATVLVVLFVGFLFVERIWFDTKLRSLTRDDAQAEQIETIIASIMRRVNRYLLVKTLVSLLTGLLVYLLMRVFGFQFAETSGILTFVLNYIPNVGSIVATILVTLIASVQVSDPGAVLAVFLAVTAIQFAIGNVLDPILMGRALQLSSFGILLALAFWGAVWGVPGMFLAVPIQVAIMIVCSHVAALRPVAVILSREGLPDGPGNGGDRSDAAGPTAAPGRGDGEVEAT